MIYIDNSSTTVIFPRSTNNEPVTIKFQNQTTKKEFEIVVSNTSTSHSFYTFDLTDDLSYFEAGQYTYWIYGAIEELETGILQFGDFDTSTEQYTADMSIVQYNG